VVVAPVPTQVVAEPPQTGGFWNLTTVLGLALLAGLLGISLVLAERSAR
jgi:hypothetical protein